MWLPNEFRFCTVPVSAGQLATLRLPRCGKKVQVVSSQEVL